MKQSYNHPNYIALLYKFIPVLFLMMLYQDSIAGNNNPFAVTTASHTNYDLVYHRISITVDPGSSAAISNGSVTTYFKTTVNNVSSIEFDLDGAMIVSSAKYHGATITKSHNATTDVLTLTIPNIAVAGTLDSVTINYSGTPILAPGSGVPSGYNYKNHGSPSKRMIYTLGEPYTGHNWWPCKETLYDKIDSVDMIVTTPDTYKVAGNGTVTETASGGNTIATWKTRYKIATYMINFAVANYVNYQYTINTGSVNLPVMNYLFPESNTSFYQNAADYAKTIIPMFVSKFGDYPFLNEKYGLAECTAGWGALEVQSMTFIASDAYNKYTIAHELAHQWFGDKLTTNTWHQIWLNEGFATYCENVIFPENLYPSELASQRSSLKSSVSNSSTTYVTDTSTPNKIFIGSGTQPYPKGAMILSMLRAWMGDAAFFNALYNYLHSPGLAYGFTSVDSLQKHAEAVIPGLNLTNFFNDWVYKAGRVTYNVEYKYVVNGVFIRLTQSPTSVGAGYFDMPVPIRIRNGSGLDTIVTIIDKRGVLYKSATGATYGSNTIFYDLSGTPTIAPAFDPNDVVLATATGITINNTLDGLIILPVKNINLSVTMLNKFSANISWSYNSEEPSAAVVLEKSFNGSDFTAVKEYINLQSTGNIYRGSFNDEITGANQYYRLKVSNPDGTYNYSEIEKLNVINGGNLLVAPNPVADKLMISLPGSFQDNKIKTVIENAAGQIVKEITLPGTVGASLVLSVQDLTSGFYQLLLINSRGEKLNARFVKQ